MPHVCGGVCVDLKNMSVLLELEFQAVMSLMWMLVTEYESSGETLNILKHWDFSPAPRKMSSFISYLYMNMQFINYIPM